MLTDKIKIGVNNPNILMRNATIPTSSTHKMVPYETHKLGPTPMPFFTPPPLPPTPMIPTFRKQASFQNK